MVDKPCLLMGHSYGAALAYLVALEMKTRGFPAPIRLILSSRPAIDFTYTKPYYKSPDADILALMRETTPEAVLREPELLQMFLAVLRADHEANETCSKSWCPECVLDTPFTLCWGGPTDKTPQDPPLETTMPPWSRFTSQKCDTAEFSGGHFYLTQPGHLSRMVSMICDAAR